MNTNWTNWNDAQVFGIVREPLVFRGFLRTRRRLSSERSRAYLRSIDLQSNVRHSDGSHQVEESSLTIYLPVRSSLAKLELGSLGMS